MSDQISAVQSAATYAASTSTIVIGAHLTLSEIATWTGIMAGVVGIVVTIFMALYNVRHKRKIIRLMESENERRK